MAKRYYWLKLPEDFFRQLPIKKLRRIAGGDTYTVIYLKMLLLSLKQDGRIYFEGVEENFSEELALELDEEEENVKVTVRFLLAHGLMKLVDETEYVLTQCSNMVGSESASAERVRRHRENKALQCNVDVTDVKRIGNVEKEIEIEKDKEKDNKYFCPELNSGQPQPKVEIEPAAENRTKVEIEPSCSRAELMVETEPAQAEILIRLPMISGEEFAVTRQYVEELKNLYPAVDIEQAFRNMRGWLDSNPKNRKTPRGIKRFITGWIAREQDRAPRTERRSSFTSNTSKNRFNNFHQRDYDWDSMERDLLEVRESNDENK
nr:phage replisome organizer N-terminal domain-containing protein [uncultured Blautia sp.]